MTDLWWSRRPGTGSPLVLVPGIGGAASHMGALAAALRGQDLIRFDPRGCGQSPVLGPEATLTGLLADLESVLDAADTPRAIIVGTSFGGVLARLLAVERPARVAGLVLAGTGMGATAPRAPKGRVAKGGGAQARLTAWLQGYGAPGWQERDRAGFLAAAKSLAAAPARPATLAAQQAALDGADAGRVRCLAVACPTLVVHGREDAVVPFAAGEALAAGIPGARLAPLSPCGHLVAWERPGDLARLVRGLPPG